MNCRLYTAICEAENVLALLPPDCSLPGAHRLDSGPEPPGVGWSLLENGDPVFVVVGHIWQPCEKGAKSCWLLKALRPIPQSIALDLQYEKSGQAIAVITLSDKGALGLREDKAGLAANRLLKDTLPVAFCQNFLLPDERDELRGLLAELSLTQKYDLICTCGGTGLSPRDITPQATASLLDFALPGFGEAMRAKSLAKTPNAIISRAICGVIGKCLVINLPGSARAVEENLEAVLPGLAHSLAKLQGDPADCGG